MQIYKVLYFKTSGRNIIINYNKRTCSKWGFEKPHREGCCTIWGLHIGKLHIKSNTPDIPNELWRNKI